MSSKEQNTRVPVLRLLRSLLLAPASQSHCPLSSTRAAPCCIGWVLSSELVPPRRLSPLVPPAQSPHSLSGQREAPGIAHDTTWGEVTVPGLAVTTQMQNKPGTKPGRPSSLPHPETQMWFQTGRESKVCLASRTLKSCLSIYSSIHPFIQRAAVRSYCVPGSGLSAETWK